MQTEDPTAAERLEVRDSPDLEGDVSEYARTILDRLPNAVTVQDADGVLVYANQAACDLVGYDSPEMMLAAGGQAAMEAWTSTHEDGRPISPDDLPGRQALAGGDPQPLVVRAVHNATGRLAWTRTQSVAIPGPDGKPEFVVNLMENFTESKRAEVRQRLLAEAGQLLSGAPNVEETLAQVADLAVPDLAEWCAFDVVDGRGGVRLAAVAHSDPEKVALARRIREEYPARIEADQGIGRALQGFTEHYPQISDELLAETAQDEKHLELMREIGLRSAIIVPVRSGIEILGGLTLVDGARSLTDADRVLAEELGRRVGDALATARMFEEQTRVARILQTALLPSSLPDVPGWGITTLYSPAAGTRVGGDFYDLYYVPGGWWLVVGDVAGRGATAAALTGMVRYTMRTAGQMSYDLDAAVRRLNQTLREHGGTSLCSLAALSFTEAGDARLLCAGHPPPAHVAGNKVTWLEAAGPMLGAFDDGQWEPHTLQIEPGDAVVMYTDGVVEAKGVSDRFGQERLEQVLAETGSADGGNLISAVREAISRFTVGPLNDDVAGVCARRLT